jgi:hypothetical protein
VRRDLISIVERRRNFVDVGGFWYEESYIGGTVQDGQRGLRARQELSR